MKDRQSNPWIHIGECPVCVNGLCRVRTCTNDGGEHHFYALCDECEATWTEPDTASQKTFPDAENPRCPICIADLFGPQAHWAHADELRGTRWSEYAIAIDIAPDQERHTLDGGKESMAAQPEPKIANPAADLDASLAEHGDRDEDHACGEDETKPGC